MYKNVVKRILDFVIAFFLILFLLPVIVVTWIMIKLDSEGPGILVQKRTGKNGKIFNMYKFRSMCVEEERNGKKLLHDERVTKAGKFIRKTSIDEIPQLFNIIKGDMSFIGPRPWMIKYYDNFTLEQKRRVEVLPGISGLAQIKGRNGLSIFDKIKYDIEYADNVSLLFDIKIIFMTILVVFKKEHAEIIQESIDDEINNLKKQFV